MAVHIRLTRVGATKHPSYRVVAIDSRRSRDGRALEILGSYDPLSDPITVQLDSDRIAGWVARGARPSAAVVRLLRVASGAPRPAPAADGSRPSRAPRRAKEAAPPMPTPETTAEAEVAPEPEAAPEPGPVAEADAEVEA